METGKKTHAIVALRVCGIVIMLAVVFYLTQYADRGRNQLLERTHAQLSVTARAIEAFRAQRGKYPTSEEELLPSFARKKATDGWGRNLIYRFRDDNRLKPFDLYSVGPNEIDEQGRGDDVDFWTREVQH